jgi:transposase
MLITEGTRADRAQAAALIVGIGAENLMADRAYDTDEIISEAKKAGMEAVMPPKRKRKEPRLYDEYLYKLRHLVENAFLHLKSWRGIATRHAKNATSFLAAARIRCIALWAGIL